MRQLPRSFLLKILILGFFLFSFALSYAQDGYAQDVYVQDIYVQDIYVQDSSGLGENSTQSDLLPGLNFQFDSENGFSQNILQVIALLTILSLAPSILIMMTSFSRIVVILSILRTALGLQQTPPNSVLVSLSLFLTFYVMSPVFVQSYESGIKPLIDNKMVLEEAIERASIPVRDFMMRQVREDDLMLFYSLQEKERPKSIEDVEIENLVPSFIISELRRAFEIGFLVFVPFIIIDMVVASVLMSMGMMMLPPVIISLPFKLIFFVLVDGWHTVTHSIIYSYI